VHGNVLFSILSILAQKEICLATDSPHHPPTFLMNAGSRCRGQQPIQFHTTILSTATLEHFQLLRSAGFPACGFRRLSSRLFREDETRDKNVPQTRRQECLRYIKVGTALTS
jgi:hypothetical protein